MSGVMGIMKRGAETIQGLEEKYIHKTYVTKKTQNGAREMEEEMKKLKDARYI